jgi:hypothetical protein
MKPFLISFVFLLQFLARDAGAATATCKSNLERFNAALLPFANVNIQSISENARHAAWMSQEMAYAAKNGCEPGRYADERAELESYESSMQDAIRMCKQVTTGGDCSPKQHFSTSGYRRPEFIRSTPDSAQSRSQASGSFAGNGAGNTSSGTGANNRSQPGISGGGISDGASLPGSASEFDRGGQSPQLSIELAMKNEAKAEEQRRKDKRRRNYADLDASDCLTPESRPGFSGFKNTCSYPVRYTYCVLSPNDGSEVALMECGRRAGAGTVPAGGESFAQMKAGQQVHHVGCKIPGTAVMRNFEKGRLFADCAKLGGE